MTIVFETLADLESLQEQAKASGKLLLLDVYASWCGPCRMLSPKLDEITASRADEILVVKGDGEKVVGLVAAYPVKNLPALFLLSDGKVLANREGGFASTAALSAWIDDAMPL